MKTVPVLQGPQPPSHRDPIRVRAHTLLCLQGFRWEGYSAAFVENLAAIHRRLSDDPTQWVEILDSPDAICGACPHVLPSGCSLRGEGSEHDMQTQDHDVLARLGLHQGARLAWTDILDRIRASLTGDSLTHICGQCRWLPLGYCREGIDRLRAAQRQPSPVAEKKSS